ncbi:hypothetical protein EKG37_00600 [Robertmurraya yapensis]|uniref:Uncharacterized protein n=1 Tax=Bacillus yapensis TaxID=2492960 RepID=A0A3S0KWR8_9BACI|nr:hypothetical protein [Bacillus yapensis]RTR36090.1 hypothetical protein EKG37_00600 [Bacillus yapensis]TKT05593.1 hypothetical protein FAR12_00600 [Bacillus yapensis]
MNRKLYFGLIVIIGAVILILFIIHQLEASDLELVQVEQHSNAQGLLLEELTFDNIVNKYSTDIVVGTVEEKSPFTNTNNLFKVMVEDTLTGDIDNEKIEVYVADEELLEIGEKYILFLSENSSTLYSKVFYVQFGQFILKVENNDVLRLVNIEKKEYVEPFVDDKYNKKDSLSQYIKEKTKNKVPDEASKAVDRASSIKELHSLSDHIIEIRAIQVEPIKNNLSMVKFDLIKSYKGGELKNVHALLLPDNAVESGKNYLIFLRNNGESVTLATREDSIVEKNDLEFGKIIESLTGLK